MGSLASNREESRELPFQAVEPYLRIAQRVGVDLEQFLADTAFTTENVRAGEGFVTWSEHCVLANRAAELVGGLDRFEEAGESYLESPKLVAAVKVARLVWSASSLYKVTASLGAAKIFPNQSSTFVQTSATTGRFELKIHEPDQPCEAFYRFTAGCLRSLPRIIDLPNSDVTWEINGRTCIYYITHAPSLTVFARFKQALKFLVFTEHAYKDLRDREHELVERLRIANRARREAEEAVRAARAAASERQAFLRNVSHELRTPMNGVIGNLELVLTGDLCGEDRGALHDAKAAAHRMNGLVERLLSFTAADIEVTTKPVCLKDLLQSLSLDYGERLASKGSRLEVHVADDLPDWVMTDARLLRSVLAPLVDNAVTYTKQGRITVSARRRHGRLRLEVEDSGIGMSKEDLQHAFDPFGQADASLRRRFEGLGLGIPVASRLVRALGGRLEAESTVGEGSRFWFDIEIRESTEAPVPDADASDADDSSASVLRSPLEPLVRVPSTPRAASELESGRSDRKIVLVVEDNRINQMVLRRMLEREGLRVRCVNDGLEALSALTEQPVGLVLMDCQMPNLDGYEATRRIRAMEEPLSKVPIVAVTAHAMEGDRERCIGAGMDDFIAKPVERDTLKEALARYLAMSSADAGGVEGNFSSPTEVS